MEIKLLLINDQPYAVQPLHAALEKLGYTVDRVCLADLPLQALPACPLAIVQTPADLQCGAIFHLRHSRQASKILSLIPFCGQGMELRLIESGADDVLVQPVTLFRLKITIGHLLRLDALERGDSEEPKAPLGLRQLQLKGT